MSRRLPLHPGHPERVCWGCEKFCAAGDMACGNGTDRAQHPIEIFGDDWLAVGLDAADTIQPTADAFNAR
jgi:hypothetical protein